MDEKRLDLLSTAIILLKFVLLFIVMQVTNYIMGNFTPEIIGLFILSVAMVTFIAALFSAKGKDKKGHKSSIA